MARAVSPRAELDQRFTWDLESIFASEGDWEKAIVAVGDRLPHLQAFQGHLGEGPDRVAEMFAERDAIMDVGGKIYAYAAMRYDEDTANQANAAKNDKAGALVAQFMAAGAFIDPELLSIGIESLNRWAAEDPRLAIFQHYFDKLESRRGHVRSAEVEEILGLATNPFRTARETHSTLADADLKFTPAASSSGDRIDISQGNIDLLLTDSDREVRRTAWENYADAHLAFKNTMASCLSSGVKQDVFNARVRRYNSSLEAALKPQHIPVEVFHNLIDTFKRHLPTWHRYWRLRRETFQYDVLNEYDIKAPLSVDAPEVSYETAVEWCVAGMQPLGADYVNVLRRGCIADRWVDIYPNQGKRAGAYSGGWRGTHPFILMSYTDDVFSMSTLAHELGHSLHSYYTWQNQPMAYSGYSTFVAEVASNFNQALVRDYVLKTNSDRAFQIALIDEAMANFHRYFLIMPTLARFELEMHERVERNEPLTADALIELMADLFGEGYGGEVNMDRDRIGITWGEFPTHLYMNFYVFQYATGISAAQALAQRVLEVGESAAEDYLKFLRCGDSLYPIDALKVAGVDMMSPEPVEAAFESLSALVDRLDGLLKANQRAPATA